MFAMTDAAVVSALMMSTKVCRLTSVHSRKLRAIQAGVEDAPTEQKPNSAFQWFHCNPNRCSYQYSIVYVDEDVEAGRFANYYMLTGQLAAGARHERQPRSLVDRR
jgi:hypothetical protein